MNFFLYKNVQISYFDEGQGEVIVLLHGFLENSGMWDFFRDEFKLSKRIISIDLLGHGQSGCLGYSHEMDENANVVFAILEYLKIDKCSIVGHSMGGYVALSFAEMHVEMVSKLVLLNSTAAADSVEKKQNRSRAIVAVKKEHETFVKMAVANLFALKNRKKLSKIIDNTKLEALKTPVQGIVASLEGMKSRTDKIDFFRNLSVKKLLLLGKLDTILNFDLTKKQAENSNIEVIAFPDGHMTHLENTAELQEVLRIFFE